MENKTVGREGSGPGIDSRLSFQNRSENGESQPSWNPEIGFRSLSDRRYAFSRQSLFRQPDCRTPISIVSNELAMPPLLRHSSSIKIPPGVYPSLENEDVWKGHNGSSFKKERSSFESVSFSLWILSIFQNLRSGSRPMKRLLVMITLNVAYSTAELVIGLFTGRVGKDIDSSNKSQTPRSVMSDDSA
ncbi:hypothetical protein ACLOJK_017302 [Asimina triloba]